MPKPVHVTHHALIRYLERVRGFNFDREIAEIRKICGCLFEVRNGSVVSILPKTDYPSATKRKEVLALPPRA